MKKILGASLIACALLPAFATAADENKIINRPFGDGPVEWGNYLVDSGAGSVSAAGMLGISGESITTVENVRDAVVALKGFDDNGSKASLALSVTPARTELFPISYTTYSKEGFDGVLARLWGAFTIGYAQGDAEISGTKFERRAVSAETSIFFDAQKDDPVLAFADRLGKSYAPGKKDAAGNDTMGDTCDARRDPEVIKAGGAATDPLKDDDPETIAPRIIGNSAAAAPLAEAQAKVRRACYKEVVEGMRWNRSRASIAYATGWIKGKDGGVDEESLGHTVAASMSWGIGDDPKSAWLLGFTYRHSFDEPVLDTLGTATINKKDTSLVVGQIKYGSTKIRALVEASNARSNDITASQRAFRQALGVDFRVMESTWLNFRYGRQRAFDAGKDENGSLLTISYSPSALLQ